MFYTEVLNDIELISDVEHPGRAYLEAPDGYRFIFENGKYVGRYNPNLETVI